MLKDYTMTPNRAGIPVWRPAQPVIGKEDEHQTALTNWARMMRTQYPALTLYHHIPNGGLRDKRTAVRLIWQGVHRAQNWRQQSNAKSKRVYERRYGRGLLLRGMLRLALRCGGDRGLFTHGGYPCRRRCPGGAWGVD